VIRLVLLAACVLPAVAADTAADVARQIRDAGLDPDACYRVRDLNFNKDDLKFYLTDGYLIFSRPVQGRRLAAVFSADVEGGDAELILLPPHRSERQSLANFTGSPNLDEHFKTALFVFADATGEELLARTKESSQKSQERGLLLESQYGPVVRNISDSFLMRLVEEVVNPQPDAALFFAAISGVKLGNFDVVHDPRSREQIMIGQFGVRNERPTYDIWASFESRPVRNRTAKQPDIPFTIADYRIEATLDEQLRMSVVTRVKLTPTRRGRAFALQLSDRMELLEARMDGNPVEIFARESLRASAMRGAGSSVFLIIPPEPLDPGKARELEFRHQGEVVFKAGNGVYAVGARGTWYPHRAADFTTYDLTFRYPKRLHLVATGEVVDDRTEGDVRITHRRTSGLVRFVGFNLGDYDNITINRSGYTVEVYGNRRVEPPLEPRPMITTPPAGPPRGRMRQQDIVALPDPPVVRPRDRLLPLAEQVAGAFDFMVKQFGPPPLKTLTVSPIPGAFGQGFPGLVYLSTLSYLSPEQRPAALRNKARQVFFSELLAAHEVAHQWWGNLVTAEAYQDAWLMEALANYSSLAYLEKRKGARVLEQVLEDYRDDLLRDRGEGKTVESLGPITWGTRLETSEGDAARTIVYEKGAWILHMLRLRMGDERFFKLLNEVCRRYQYKSISTGAFRALAEEFMPGGASLEGFFESWVYGTGIPKIGIASAVKGKAPAVRVTATVTQTEVDEDFSADVPVEIHTTGAPPVIKWVRTSSEPVTITSPVKRLPSKVLIPPTAVLAKR
jgi:hypothetical protein